MSKRKNEDKNDPPPPKVDSTKGDPPINAPSTSDPPLPPKVEHTKVESENTNPNPSKKAKVEKKVVVREKVILNQKLETLDDLIELANKYDPTKDYNFNLKRLHKILPPLIKLKNVIGMKSVKDSIVGQIVFFLNEFDGGKNQDMLHTIIQGPPGVGKTTLGKIIGELYYYLDIIKPVAKKTKVAPKPPARKIKIISFEELLNMELDHYMNRRKDGKDGAGKKVDEEEEEEEDDGEDEEKDDDCGCDDEGEEGWGGAEGKGKGGGKEGDTFKFKIVKRSDLVAGYLGQSTLKTQKMIDSCEGGVMFIDEAYSLGNPENRDSFSKEVIDCLNQNLSEQKCNLLCIIAGYKDALDKCFFSYNEGLRRRFPFVYTIEKYTPEELSLIFKKMVSDIGWNADDVPEKFFKDNYECFENSGGDIESLMFLCKINSAKRTLFESENKKKINLKDLENSFKQFKINKDLKTDKDDAKDAPWRTMYT
jgi:SpoVK/Ycf46/Vps4 family AAA+-type ATPase